MVELTPCGILEDSNTVAQLCCDGITGDLVLVSDYLGNVIVSEVALENPEYTPINDKRISSFIEKYESNGVALGCDYFIIFKNEYAYYYHYYDLDNPYTSIKYDLLADYDEDFRFIEDVAE